MCSGTCLLFESPAPSRSGVKRQPMLRYYHRRYAVLAQPVFPFSLSSFLFPFFVYFFPHVCFLPLYFPFGHPWGLLKRWGRYGHHRRKNSKWRTDQAAPNPLAVAFGTQFGCCPDAARAVSSALLLRFFARLIIRHRFCIRYADNDAVIGRTVFRNNSV